MGFLHAIQTHARSAVVPVGLVVLVVAAQVLGLLAALTVVRDIRPASLYEWWVGAAAAMSVGWVLVSAVSCRPRTVLASLRVRTRGTTAAVVGGAAAAAFVLPAVARQTGSTGRTVALVSAVAQPLLVMVFVLWTRRPPAGQPQHASGARVLANLLIVPFLATSAVISLGALPDVYPLSRYPMFSIPRLDPYTWNRVMFYEVDESGASRPLGAPAARQVLLALADRGDVDRLEQIAAALQDRHSAQRVRVVRETLRVAPYPEPARPKVVSTEELVSLD